MSDYLCSIASRLRPFLTGAALQSAGRSIDPHLPRNIFRSYVQICRTAINTKGFAVLFFLYLLRYPSLFSATRNLVISAALFFALCANFNLDLESSARRRGLTPGISRLVLFGVCYAICRKAKKENAPLYCGVAIRVVPIAMFFLFRLIYYSSHRLLRSVAGPPTIPRARSSKGPNGIDPSAQCCICLELDCTYTTPCGHHFHTACIDGWLEVKSRCPLCSARIASRSETLRQLQEFFLLDYAEWVERHQVFAGNWWVDPLVTGGG